MTMMNNTKDDEQRTSHDRKRDDDEEEDPLAEGGLTDTEVSSSSSSDLSKHTPVAKDGKDYDDDEEDAGRMTCIPPLWRRRRRQGRVALRTGVLVLLGVTMLVIAVPIWTTRSRNRAVRRDDEREEDASESSSWNDDTDAYEDDEDVISNDVAITSPTTAANNNGTDAVTRSLCTEVSYRLNRLSMTAEELLHHDDDAAEGETLREGLETAAGAVVREFVVAYPHESSAAVTDGHRRGLRSSPPSRPRPFLALDSAAVTGAVDLSARLCAKPHCLLVSHDICLRVRHDDDDHDDDEEEDRTIRAALRQALRDAIRSGRFLDGVPPAAYLPSS